MKYRFLIIIITLLALYSKINAQDTSKSINGVVVSKYMIEDIQKLTGKPALNLKFYYWQDSFVDAFSYGYYDTVSHGIYFKGINEKLANKIFNMYYHPCIGKGNYIYMTHYNFDSALGAFYDIAIIKAADQYEAIKMVATAGINYDIKTKDIIEKIRKWDAEVGLLISVIDYNRIGGSIQTKPKDLKKLTKEISEFCPDVIDKGYGSLKKMRKDYKERQYFWLWWE